MKKLQLNKILFALLISAILTALLLFEVLYNMNNSLSDKLYQKEKVLEDNIILINIDQRALEEIGPIQTWGRGVVAKVINTLNADENSRPAAIGIDMIFAAATDPQQDAQLAEAAGQYDNVVLATAFSFDSDITTAKDGSFQLDNRAIESYDEPYEALKANTQQGHINAMYDKDGILRHCILKVSLPDGTQIPSFHYQIASMYGKKMGIEIQAPP
ncbi:MAG: CHASE2 domain-containing protein, partial [Lachnospiraceae bacterium]